MIVEYLRYTIPTDRTDAFTTAYNAAATPLLASPWCNAFDMSHCIEDPTQFILRIQWTSAEDHLERFRKSDEFRAFFLLVKPYVSAIDEMRHYELLISK